MSTHAKIQSTTGYDLFDRGGENRRLNLKKHKRLAASMQKYGFLKCFPIVVRRGPGGKWVVKDGQHRLAIAESLGLPVWWVEETTDFDVAVVNSTPKVWALSDFAEKYADNGVKAYSDGLAFAAEHGIPLGAAFALLGGTTSFGNVETQFVDGTFKVKDRAWAEAVAGVYGPFVKLAPGLRNAVFLTACMAVCRVGDLDPKRLTHGAQRCRDKLTPYGTRDGYLDMMEAVYNFGRSKLFPLKNEAVMAMRNRGLIPGGKKKPAAAAPAVA